MKYTPCTRKLFARFKAPYSAVNRSRWNVVSGIVFSTLLFSASDSDAQQINCAYPTPELSDLCLRYDQSDIIVHNNVSETGLNDLVSTWDQPGKLHLIPAKVYQLNQPLRIPSDQAILPISSSLKGTAAMITLSLGSDYSWTEYDHFSVLMMDSGTRVGGVVINGNNFLSSYVPEQNEATTLVSINSSDTQLLTSQLMGDSAGKISQLISIKSSSASDSGQVLLSRNQLKGHNSAILVKAALGKDQTLTLKNNMLEMPSDAISGVKMSSGSVEAIYNDFLFTTDYCDDCSALNLHNAQAFTINNNMFWASESLDYDVRGLSLGASGSTKSKGFITANTLSSGISLTNLAEGDSDHAYQILGNNYVNALRKSYLLGDPEKFFAFTGNLGNTAMPTVLLRKIEEYTTIGNNMSDLSLLQQPVSYNVTGFTAYSLLSEAQNPVSNCTDFCQDANAQISFSTGGTIGLASTVALFLVADVITFSLCYTFGKTKRAPPPGFSRFSVTTE